VEARQQAGFAMTAPADKGKKAKTDADGGEENEQIDVTLVLSIEKLQEIQDELEKVSREPLLSLPLGIIGLVVVRCDELWSVGHW
jgi:hypothetical protein